jgi:hypothetical protein
VLKSLGSREGDYVVVLDIFYEIIHSEFEYTEGLDEYAFRLTVDPNMDTAYPLRLLVDDKTYYLGGSDGINSGNALAGMAASIPTATVTRETDIDFYLAPQGTLQSVAAYDGSFRLMMIEPDIEPLVTLPVWEAGDYYFVFTATFPFEGGSLILEYPIHIKLVEEIEEETYPNDVGETPEPPRVTVTTGFGELYFGNEHLSSDYCKGYMLWTEQWYDGGMVSGDGLGAEGRIPDILEELPTIRHYACEPVSVKVQAENDTLTRISVCTPEGNRITTGTDTSILSASALEEGTYIVILTVETQGNYIEEADAYERTCTEYAFRMEIVEEQAGIPGVPETNPRVVVSGGGQTAVFATEEDGFLAWTEVRQSPENNLINRLEGTPAADVIFATSDNTDPLPSMEIVDGDDLTLTLGAAGDELVAVMLYDAKGNLIVCGDSLGGVISRQSDEGDRHMVVILQVTSRISETEIACYEYAFELTCYASAPQTEDPLVLVTGTEVVIPYGILTSYDEWTGSDWVGERYAIVPPKSFADEIPAVAYTAKTRIRPNYNIDLKSFELLDGNFKQVRYGDFEFDITLDELYEELNALPDGTYYLMLHTVKFGRYIEGRIEEWDTTYFVALTIS